MISDDLIRANRRLAAVVTVLCVLVTALGGALASQWTARAAEAEEAERGAAEDAEYFAEFAAVITSKDGRVMIARFKIPADRVGDLAVGSSWYITAPVRLDDEDNPPDGYDLGGR